MRRGTALGAGSSNVRPESVRRAPLLEARQAKGVFTPFEQPEPATFGKYGLQAHAALQVRRVRQLRRRRRQRVGYIGLGGGPWT